MKLLMTADAVGGVWTYALDLARELTARGVEVHLATMGPPPRVVPEIEGLTLHVGDYKLEWEPEPWDDVAAAGDWLLSLARETKADAVHLNGFGHAGLDWPVPPLVVAHSDVATWFRAVKGTDAPPEWDRYRAEVARGLRAAETIVAPTQAYADALAREYGPIPNVTVILNARATELYAPAEKAPVVLGVGRLWDEAKNARALADAAPDLAWPVRLAGEGGEGLTNVALLGRLSPEALAAEYAQAAIYAHPARYEPFGLSVLEAALSGCALVLGDIPTLRENWEGAALFCPPESPGPTIARLVEDAPLREDLARAARERARAFSPKRQAETYMKLYKQAVPA